MSMDNELTLERMSDTPGFSVLNQMRLEKNLCDVLLRVDRQEFHAHKIILCSCSTYFRALFTNGCYPAYTYEFSIPGISAPTMALILDYAYLHNVTITQENVCELLVTADYLAVSSLVNKCCAFLKPRLCLENCISMWRFADVHFCQKLKRQAFCFLLNNFKDTMNISDEFLEMTVEELSEIIENDELNVKREEIVFEAILKWTAHKLSERRKHLGVLVPRVRLALLKQQYFMSNVMENALVMNNAACGPLITSIFKHMDTQNPDMSISPNLRRPRRPSTILLAIGGWTLGVHKFSGLHIESYNMVAGRWVKVACGKERLRAYHGSAYLNGFVYCIGGRDNLDYFHSVRKFDPVSRSWAQVGFMHSCRCSMSVCVLDAHIYVMGGFDGHKTLETVECYNPQNDQWSIVAPMQEKRCAASATALGGKVYICGGSNSNGHLFTAECYSPEMNQWNLIHPMTCRRCRLGVAAYGGCVYVIGGFDGVAYLRSAEVYDPSRDSWSHLPDMFNPRSDFGIEVVNDLLLVVGGYNIRGISQNVESYDRETTQWTEVADMEFPCMGLSCCVVFGLPNMAEYTASRDSLH